MIKEVILGIVSLLSIGIALSKRDIIFTVITFGLAAGAFIYILGVQTINISFFVAFTMITLLVAMGQKGIPTSNRAVMIFISGLVILGEVALNQQWNNLHFFQYAMIIPLIIYFFVLLEKPKLERGFSCITLITADALTIFLEGIV